MQDTDIPSKFDVPFGASATGGFIRTVPVTTTDPNAASLTVGFPPNTFQPEGGGGSPPDGRDFNGILNVATAWNQWQQAGGTVPYDSAFSTAIGGYPKGAVLASATAGQFWLSTADNNTTDPDTGGAGWVSLYLLASKSTWGGTAGGSANSQLLTIPGANSLSDLLGVSVRFLPVAPNTNTVGITINSLATIQVRKSTSIGLLPLAGKELGAQTAEIIYDGTFFQLVNPAPKAVTYQTLTSPSANYVPTSPDVTSIRVKMIAGGGGGGSPGGAGPGGPGGDSFFGGWIVKGGGGGGSTSGTNGGQGGGIGGTGTNGTGTLIIRIPGAVGGTGLNSNVTISGSLLAGLGAPSSFGPGGSPVTGNQSANGGAAPGSGGSGGPNSNANLGTSGGGASGEYVEFSMIGPFTSIAYGMGTAGTAVGAGLGIIGTAIVEEHYD